MDGKTIWELAMDAFNETDIEIYPPATKNGECKSKYIVVKTAGSTQLSNYSTEQHFYNILLYVPQNEYDELEEFKNEVVKAINEKLFPLLMPTGQEQPDFFDDSYKAHVISIQYRNNVRNKYL